jgi:hypothetical protein
VEVKARILIFFLIAAVSGCVKPPSYPIVPHIEFKSVSSSLVKSGYTDTVTISFTDGDGDIGVNGSASDSCDICSYKHGDTTCFYSRGFNVFLIDSRDTCLGLNSTANIETSGKYNSLSGDILIITAIDSKTCQAPPDPNCPLDSLHYSIVIRDEAGHLSNFVKSSVIYVDGR